MSILSTNTIQSLSGQKMLGTTGGILQVVQTVKTDTFSTTSTSLTDVTGLNASISLSSSTNKVLILADLYLGIDNPSGGAWLVGGCVARNYPSANTIISRHDVAGSRTRLHFGSQAYGNNDSTMYHGIKFLDTPGTTSSISYSIQLQAESPRTVYVNRGVENDGDTAPTARFVSTFSLIEVVA